MARDPAPPLWRDGSKFLHPWLVVGIGLGTMVLGWLIGAVFSTAPPLLRLLLLFGGFFVAALGLSLRFRQGRWEMVERIETAAMLAVTGLGCLACYFGMGTWARNVAGEWELIDDWTSGRMFFGALFLASLLGVALVLLPSLGRRVLLSIVILYHFGGLATAVTVVDPPGSTGPWISRQLWTWVYRPYLSFLYLTNAYHFYSPDPGPPNLFWFAACYDDGSYTWIKLPERANSPIQMHYQRLLALPEHTFQPQPRLPYTNLEKQYLGWLPDDQRRRGTWEEIYYRRQVGSTKKFCLLQEEDGEMVERHLPIPLVFGVAENLQYREPHETSKRVLASVARRIYLNAPQDTPSGAHIRSVKLYRVTHQILTPQELAKGVNPLEKTKYWPVFLGEFDGQGRLVDSLDPFLYWYLPIAYVSKDFPGDAPGVPIIHLGEQAGPDKMLLDCMEMHAAGQVRKKEGKKQ
jgi:hypothetical protein